MEIILKKYPNNVSPWINKSASCRVYLLFLFNYSLARPDFIKPLNGYAGFAYNSTNVSIECWVECSPICNISWTRDGLPMNFDKTDLYYQTNVYHPPDQSKNDFESIQSTLVWNMTSWPDGHLHPFRDNENFTCESTGNGIGPGVKSETVFRVECEFFEQ